MLHMYPKNHTAMKRLNILIFLILLTMSAFSSSIRFTNRTGYSVGVEISGCYSVCLPGCSVSTTVFSGSRTVTVSDRYTGEVMSTTVVHVFSGERVQIEFWDSEVRCYVGSSTRTVVYVPLYHPVHYYHDRYVHHSRPVHCHPVSKPAAPVHRPAAHAKPDVNHGSHANPPARTSAPRSTVNTRSSGQYQQHPHSSSTAKSHSSVSSRPMSSSTRTSSSSVSSGRQQSSRSTTSTRR